MKCSACQANKCEGKFENRNKCRGRKEKIECTCWCQVSKAEVIGTSAMSIGAGVAMAAGGVALTVMTGGLFAIVSGAALVGAGSSMVMNPIQKTITGECMTLKDSATDIALGATIGKKKSISMLFVLRTFVVFKVLLPVRLGLVHQHSRKVLRVS